MTRPSPRPRARALGLSFGSTPTGPANAITDVPGVRVGHVTIWHGVGDEPIARTGVTAVVPDAPLALFHRPMPAGTAVLNGAGELTGSVEIEEFGILETPVLLTGTSSVGRVGDGIVDELFAAGVDEVVIPVVGECDDSRLDDIRRRWVTAAHARDAIAAAAGGSVEEGAVGAGCGMVTMGHKGGIGTSSRVLEGLGTIGVLLLCNFGSREQLRIGGALVGEALERDASAPEPAFDTGGSCLGVVFTDIPLDTHQLRRVARRVGLGLARCGSVGHHGSGDIFLAVSTANRAHRDATGLRDLTLLHQGSLNEVFSAVVDATEESVCNALFVADTSEGVGGAVVPGLPVPRVLSLLNLPAPPHG